MKRVNLQDEIMLLLLKFNFFIMFYIEHSTESDADPERVQGIQPNPT